MIINNIKQFSTSSDARKKQYLNSIQKWIAKVARIYVPVEFEHDIKMEVSFSNDSPVRVNDIYRSPQGHEFAVVKVKNNKSKEDDFYGFVTFRSVMPLDYLPNPFSYIGKVFILTCTSNKY